MQPTHAYSTCTFARAKEIIRTTPKKEKGSAYDTLQVHVTCCTAAEIIRSSSAKIAYEEWKANYYVLKNDADGLTPTDQQTWLAISKYCIDMLNHENLTAEILDVYTDASGPYLDDGEEAEDFDVEQPRACSVPAQEESAADELAAVIKLMFFNDSVLMMVKATDEEADLQPLLKLSLAVLDKYQQCSVDEWRQQAWPQVTAAWDSVLFACYGFI